MLILENCTGFAWDKGNTAKNLKKHNVSTVEAEEIFFNQPLLFYDDLGHTTENEARYIVFGKTNQDRRLFCAFTIREQKIRVISVRDMHKKERSHYEEAS
jgi:uncharacterized DUF497 family protein